jgi:hypothetical protein
MCRQILYDFLSFLFRCFTIKYKAGAVIKNVGINALELTVLHDMVLGPREPILEHLALVWMRCLDVCWSNELTD